MKTTFEYFGTKKEDLKKVVNDSGYTKEECLLLDESASTKFFDNLDTLYESKKYMISHGYYVKSELLMTDGRIAVLFN